MFCRTHKTKTPLTENFIKKIKVVDFTISSDVINHFDADVTRFQFANIIFFIVSFSTNSDVIVSDVIVSDVIVCDIIVSDVIVCDVIVSDVINSDVIVSDVIVSEVIISDVIACFTAGIIVLSDVIVSLKNKKLTDDDVIDFSKPY